jgi:ABC-type transport system involved in multi-copper enzyme maturation permease subunit
MKTLIRKELRENLILTVLGLVVLVLFILLRYRDYTWSLEHTYLGSDAQPLMSREFVDFIHFFCAVFGGILGWMQVWNERHRDLWAFLVHRPLTRTQLFLGKCLAGLLIYFLMPGLPLLGCVIWVAQPGHVAAPFEWQMVQPLTTAFLAGIVYYFAGMLTGLRQARWYASRGLGLVVAFLVSAGVSNANQFGQALFYLLGSTAVLGTAVWGAFHNEGHYEGQPAPG